MIKHYIYFASNDSDKAELMGAMLNEVARGFNCDVLSSHFDSIYAFWDKLGELSLEQQSNTLVIFDPAIYNNLPSVINNQVGGSNYWNESLNGRELFPWYELVLRYPLITPMFLVLDEKLLLKDVTNAEGSSLDQFPPVCFLDLGANIKTQLRNNLKLFFGGIRTWFDPFGLRECWRQKVMKAICNDKENSDVSEPKSESKPWFRFSFFSNKKQAQDKVSESDNMSRFVFCIEDEIEYALLNGYAAYKYGARVNIINSVRSLKWIREKIGAIYPPDDVYVIRDKDMRFCDYVNDDEQDSRKKFHEIEGLFPEHHELKNLVVSTNIEIEKEPNSLSKPLQSMYMLTHKLNDWRPATHRTKLVGHCKESVSRKNNHAAPYLNLQLARNILSKTSQPGENFHNKVFLALLKLEAYMMLDRMAPTTAMQILKDMHLAELEFELSFMGVSKNQSVEERKKDIERDVDDLLMANSSKHHLKQSFLVSFWNDARAIYKQYEQFNAAEESNVEAMTIMDWM